MDYDIIGDIHGQIGKLEALLKQLGYRVEKGAWRHPQGRMALFLGDLIDRGPGQVEVLTIVRNMIEAGSARAVMGNHEWNAIGFATEDPEGGDWLRPRTDNKVREHKEFLDRSVATRRSTRNWSPGSRPCRPSSTSAICALATPGGTRRASRG